MKSQAIRLADVFVVGPFMLWAAIKLGGRPGAVLAALGFLTIAYNGDNYLAAARGRAS